MKHHKISILLIFVVSFVSSCVNLDPKPDCTRYFVLKAKNKEQRVKQTQEMKQWILGVWFASVPAYLERPGIAVKVSANELNFSEWNRWAEPLDKGFSRVLAEDLRSRLQNFNVISFSRSSIDLTDYELHTAVNEFIGDVCNRRVYLRALWSVVDSETGRVILMEESTIEVPLGENLECECIAAGMSEAIARFADIVGEKLKTYLEVNLQAQ